MITDMMRLAKKSFDSPDTTRDCGHGKLELATLEDTTLARVTLLPGWKWSEHIRPVAKTDHCEVEHRQYVIRGRLRIVQEDGSEMELGPGDFAMIPPGHDAWVVGDEPFVCIDFSPDMKQYAQERHEMCH